MIRAVYSLFLFLLIFSPLAFGTVEQWSLTVMETVSMTALSLLLFIHVRNRDYFLHNIPGIVPLLLLNAYILLQIVPLPSLIVRFISPETYVVYGETSALEETLSWVSLSLNKKATIVDFFRLAAYTAFYVLTVQLLKDRKYLKRTVLVLVVLASVISLQSIMQYLFFNGKIYWLREIPKGAGPFGPYVNRNHFAGYMNMLFPVVLSMFIAYRPHIVYGSLRSRIVGIFSQGRTNLHVLIGFAAVLVSISIFLSLSRGGISGLGLSIIFFAFLMTKAGQGRRGVIFIAVIYILIALSVSWFGWDAIIERFAEIGDAWDNNYLQRIEVYRNSLNIIHHFPVTGTGFGTFMHIFPRYRTVPGESTVNHAHNDYIEFLSDGGVISLIFAGWFLIAVFYSSYRVFLRRRDLYAISIFTGSVTGMIAVLIHGMVDFNLHIGANGLYFFFLSGLMVSAANTRFHGGRQDTYLRKHNVPYIRLLLIIVVFFSMLCVTVNAGIFFGQRSSSSHEEADINKGLPEERLIAMKNIVHKSIRLDPLEARYRYELANIERILNNNTEALAHYRKAVELNPSNGEYLQALGLFISGIGNDDSADKLFSAGVRYDASNPTRYRAYVSWLLSRGRKESGVEYLKRAISIEPGNTGLYITLMLLNGFNDTEMLETLPHQTEPHIIYAYYLIRTGKEEMAEEPFSRALYYAEVDGKIRASLFYTINKYYRSRGDHEKALSVMKTASRILPDNAGIRFYLGQAYEDAGITYRAREEYREALILDPSNEMARKRLDAIK